MSKHDDRFDPVYMAAKTQFEVQAVIQQAAHGDITSDEAMDQIEDVVACCIVEGIDYAFESLYSTNTTMFKHILAKAAEALQHRSEHLELYFENPDVNVNDE